MKYNSEHDKDKPGLFVFFQSIQSPSEVMKSWSNISELT